jgi:hypothetical protein
VGLSEGPARHTSLSSLSLFTLIKRSPQPACRFVHKCTSASPVLVIATALVQRGYALVNPLYGFSAVAAL